MPFKEISIKSYIDEQRGNDADFKQAWDSSREEYRILGELVKLRKENGFSQTELARHSGLKQQVISRMENRENSPTLRTLCNLLDTLGYQLEIVPKVK
ncbi:helix-turn-helix domain-containing protein [Oscillibacter sp.]|uniref:helix-turn-helix domain-containing protein n=1 Tax=Oscillibacter sp. TaxID=1945593 RepID=UPI0028A28C68|nr:helix-turn-helix domain-containing protein [Oscillibacter sp.]